MVQIEQDRESLFWQRTAATLDQALPQIDSALSRGNAPISKRMKSAIDLVVDHLIEVNCDKKTFVTSEAYARLFALIEAWYSKRYGDALKEKDEIFHSMIVIYSSPFLFNIPSTFSIAGEEDGTQWVGWPATVQKEEDPLRWILNGPNLEIISEAERESLGRQARWTGTAIRSINFDLKTIVHGKNIDCAELASTIIANLKSAALSLCSRENGRLKNAGWEFSQAVEKTLKLYVRRNGETPSYGHVLENFATHAERFGKLKIDRTKLHRVPSGKHATDLRYTGIYSIREGLKAYDAAINIIQRLAFAATVKGECNIREARFLIQTPPWFKCDTTSFLKALGRAAN